MQVVIETNQMKEWEKGMWMIYGWDDDAAWIQIGDEWAY